jgi:peptidyl-prolyl cis-trans isomerase B (cyclophilin B)
MTQVVRAESPQGHPVVVLDTSMGEIVLKLDAEKAPKTVENFLAYVEADFYDGTIFHRVIDRFMIQGGGFTADMTKKPTRDPVPNEADNGLKNSRGTIAMARTQAPDSATSQFFINLVDNAALNHMAKTPQGWGYAVFGEVIEGMEVVDAAAKVKTGSKGRYRDVPVEVITIREARLKPAE